MRLRPTLGSTFSWRTSRNKAVVLLDSHFFDSTSSNISEGDQRSPQTEYTGVRWFWGENLSKLAHTSSRSHFSGHPVFCGLDNARFEQSIGVQQKSFAIFNGRFAFSTAHWPHTGHFSTVPLKMAAGDNIFSAPSSSWLSSQRDSSIQLLLARQAARDQYNLPGSHFQSSLVLKDFQPHHKDGLCLLEVASWYHRKKISSFSDDRPEVWITQDMTFKCWVASGFRVPQPVDEFRIRALGHPLFKEIIFLHLELLQCC
ncbi:unnamed protein product [Cyclocybe aegerita]|uniref:Uncharacterized protein n=1 Tax=Cyclocybe aegerita TaxID=1973307 RepID=A0A8S0VXB8_CYCAE|nr:unnamed protein product [Cyclocybe aegerita]